MFGFLAHSWAHYHDEQFGSPSLLSLHTGLGHMDQGSIHSFWIYNYPHCGFCQLAQSAFPEPFRLNPEISVSLHISPFLERVSIISTFLILPQKRTSMYTSKPAASGNLEPHGQDFFFFSPPYDYLKEIAERTREQMPAFPCHLTPTILWQPTGRLGIFQGPCKHERHKFLRIQGTRQSGCGRILSLAC